MNISELSIRRPVLSTVMTLIILLFGFIGYSSLGVREYPSVDNPIISVSCSYPGANADVIENQITEPLEQNINGIPGIRSLSSTSSQGSSRITVEFELSVDLETAANDVRDKVSRAQRYLPRDCDPPTVSKADADATPIQISVYPDHIVFWNAGRLPENWTTARLFEKHPSKPYNPSIANTLFRCGDIESWGRGYKRIIDSVLSHKLLPPVIEVVSGLMIAYYTDVKHQLKAQKVEEKYFPIMEYVAKNGKITNADVQKLLNVSKTTAYRILTQLEAWLDIHGVTGKGTYYTLKGFTKGSK